MDLGQGGCVALIGLTQTAENGRRARDGVVAGIRDRQGEPRERCSQLFGVAQEHDLGRIDFDAGEQKAVVSLRLSTQFNRIPVDSSAAIYTQGILGGKFVGLTNGGSELYLKNQDRIADTRSAMPLENVIGQLFTRYLNTKTAQPGAAENGGRQP